MQTVPMQTAPVETLPIQADELMHNVAGARSAGHVALSLGPARSGWSRYRKFSFPRSLDRPFATLLHMLALIVDFVNRLRQTTDDRASRFESDEPTGRSQSATARATSTWILSDAPSANLCVEPMLASEAAIQQAINVAYADRSSQAQQVIDAIDRDTVLR